ncbi:unnamed protein product [Blepharisma stoltei]|uniref:Uncharacterized protein n=1 Tax=Blepharisma stoltei TaxID=1481888 RepID=A0AAU9KEV1_9CILI|nr:unnamed protein product [Blepharisma stoltei]
MKHENIKFQGCHSGIQTPNRSFQSIRLRNLNEERLRIKSLDKKDQLLSKIQSASDIFEIEHSWAGLKECMIHTQRNGDSTPKLKLPLSKTKIRDLSPNNTSLLCSIAMATQQALSTIKFLEKKRTESGARSNDVSFEKISKEISDDKNICNNSFNHYKSNLENVKYDLTPIKEYDNSNLRKQYSPINFKTKSPFQRAVTTTQKPPKSNKLTPSSKTSRVIDTKMKNLLNTSQDFKRRPLSPFDVKTDKILKNCQTKMEDLKFDEKKKIERKNKPKKLSKAQEFSLLDRLQHTANVTRILERLNN